MFKLKTNRLLLRDFCEEDVAPYQIIGSHPEVLKYYAHTAEEWHTRAVDLVHLFMQQSQAMPRLSYTLAIVAKEAFIGVVSIRTESVAHRQGSIGCSLAIEHWSNGYAAEAMKAAIALGFETLNLHRIYAETISENKAAIALAQRVGLRVEGEFKECQRFKGQWWNQTILSILK